MTSRRSVDKATRLEQAKVVVEILREEFLGASFWALAAEKGGGRSDEVYERNKYLARQSLRRPTRWDRGKK